MNIKNEKGLNPEPVKDNAWRIRFFYIYDPEGNRLEYWSSNIKFEKTI
ncbi:MAG: VOC family protein [Desulfobacterales bacterium]|nr:VOC family protein [Desulfobacterales bacterium]